MIFFVFQLWEYRLFFNFTFQLNFRIQKYFLYTIQIRKNEIKLR